MWHQPDPTDYHLIEPDLEGTFLCRHCIVTESSKRKRDETLRNHLEEGAIVEDNEEYIQSLIAMLHSSEESEEDGSTEMEMTMIDSLCATPALHPWTGRLSLCGAMSTQASQKKVNIHINSLPADVLAKPIPMEKLLGPSPELEYDPSAWLNNPDEDPEYATTEEILAAGEWEEATIKGTPQEIAKLRLIAHNRREVFSSKLPYLPARVTPLSFHVKEDEWQQSSNRLSPRRQSLAKDVAIEQMTRDLVERNVLSTSKATAWSQVHLQKKPAGSKDPWRYCIDFRRLNSSLANTGWPLPKIRDLLTRIGDAKPTHFGKFDLTNGYHQMPLAKESQAQTAFVTPSGLFEWKRVPMGIKQAAGYFQRVMQQVLGDLLYNGVELYIDDIIVYASSFEEYERLTKAVLERLAKAGIVVSPRKSYLGMSELEILGHTVNAKGVTFSKEKLQGVLDFPLPTTTTKLQSFLGLTTYFRDHVQDMSKLERPLRDMLKAKANKKHVTLTWDDSSRKAFKALQQAVWNCATLFFYDNTLPVYLHTDACDTGIGAYLFQLDRDGKELPIGFMSQALHDAQLRWSTFEQEAFAIHEALKKFQYILRDVQFTLRTDHRNLLYLNDSGASDKVLRWKLDIQQFDFLVEHIPGEQNIVADLYSRLCSLRSSNLPSPNQEWMERNMERQDQPDPSAAHWLARLEARNTVEKKPHTRDASPMTSAHRDVIATCHGGLCGHGGVERTLRLMKDRVPASEHWPNMRKDIRQYIQTCPACQFMQPSKMLIATTAPYNMSVHSPMDRINIDTIGPLPEDADGNKYIVVIIDVFSRYAELYATKDATAITAAKCMVHWIGHYGIPGELLTDNGKQYTADIIEQLCELLQLDHLTIMPYSHQENAIVERANREVNRILRAIVFDMRVKKDWSLYLPLVGRVMNSMKHSSIGCAPADILFGKSVDLNRGLFPDKARLSQTTGEPLNEYLSKLLSVQGAIIEIAQKTQYETSAEHIQKKLVKGDRPYDLKVDDWVILEIPNTFTSLDNRLDKLSMHYRGPYLVKEIDGSAFLLKNLATNAVFTANQAHLHPFNYESEYTDPATVQRHVEQEFLVEEILQHKGKRKANKQFSREGFEVLVQWTGYSEDYNSWEPFENMKDTAKFHEYLVKNKLKYLLTAEAKRALADLA
jgi:putative transposase